MGPVLVLGNAAKKGVAAAVEKFRPRLDREFGIAAIDLEGTLDLQGVEAKWVLVFGGDGAVLAASRRMGDRPLPTMAVNFGRLGFLTEVEYRQLDDALDRMREGKVTIRDRMRLSAQVGGWEHHALNDVVVTGAQTGRLFHVSAKIEHREAVSYSGDGVVIATPTGSTAYNLAAGGPILDPDLEAIVITPLAAHALSQRSLVIPADQKIDVYVRKGDARAVVIVDGQMRRELGSHEKLRVRKAKEPFLLVRVGMRSYYSRLRRMLGWGGSPRYSR